jgi:hypothetical protein
VLRRREAGFDPDKAVAVEQFEGHARLLQDLDILADAVQLLLRAEQLQRALGALVVADAGLVAQRAQAVAAVLGQTDHAALVDAVGGLVAVGEHLQAPTPHRRVEHRLDDQRPVPHQQPFDRLQRHARPGPRRRIAGRHLARVGVARLQRRTGLPVDHRHLVVGTGEVVRHRGSDHAAAEHQYAHVRSSLIDARRGARLRAPERISSLRGNASPNAKG